MNRPRNELGRGIALGAGMGVVTHYIAMCVGVGTALGALIGLLRSRR